MKFIPGRCVLLCLLLAVTSLVDAHAETPLPDKVRVLEPLAFSDEDPELKIYLTLPAETDEPVPCVVVIPGGGFRAAQGMRYAHITQRLAENGLAVAQICYRGRPDHTYPDTISDVKAAVRYIRSISDQYSIDPDKIGAVGNSAGGTLTALLAVTGGMPEYEGQGGHHEFSSRIQAAVCGAGVFDFVARFEDERQVAMQPRVDVKVQTNGEWVGVPFSAGSEDWKNVSAIHYVDKDDAPTLFLCASDDKVVPWYQSLDMYETMVDAGGEAEIKIYSHGGHDVATKTEDALVEMVSFFKRTLVSESGSH
ncbi:alpha/beta hydrolase [Ruficoccus sp. ZRK36]|uniref:alpha/beta hydrolase n=1 Tax=Ruficoccus sp. ZRK36 TaxID=2866311 RepID=UPI001C73540F|nr:alpha/beta hydrolase [Ruficoccus sp. ZRK36]QYY35350.1 alpha/beta hydrolase [Ruficoccus sp. ZRK36]